MIIAALSLLTAQDVVPATTPVIEDDIVVLARRLQTVRWTYDAKDGALVKCTIKRSGGPVADALVCEASRQCAAENPKVGDRHLAPCIKSRVGRLFAERRATSAQSIGQP